MPCFRSGGKYTASDSGRGGGDPMSGMFELFNDEDSNSGSELQLRMER